jgi:uncharacterized protein
MLADPAFWAVAAPAVIILGLAKGGFAGVGVLAVPLMALVIPPMEAASIVLPILLVQDVVSVLAFRRAVAWGILRLMLPGAALGIFMGYALAAFVSAAAVELAVGMTAIAFGAHRLWGQRAARAAEAVEAGGRRGSPWLGVLCAVASGFTSQVAHAGGPPFQIYVLPKRLPRDVFIGTSAVFFAVVNWLKVPAYLGLGQMTPPILAAAGALLPLAVISTWAGVWLVRRIKADRFYTLIYVLLVAVGLKLVVDGVTGL